MKKHALQILTICCALALCLGMAACSSNSTSEEAADENTTSSEPAPSVYIASAPEESPYAVGIHHAVLSVEGYAPITIELDADAAPVTVYNFCTLAEGGFYDGLSFHRIIDGFCLQGGDPVGNGTGGSDLKIVGEFSGNGVDNAMADNYVRGTVAMARASDPNSASCQFFVTLSDDAAASLNGQYAAFGMIDEAGMAIVDQIVADYVDIADDDPNGTINDLSQQPVITSITVVD